MTRQRLHSGPTARRSSQYTLTIPAPEHADADLQAALDALTAAVTPTVQGSYITRATPHANPTLSVAWRSVSDEHARAEARDVLAAYAAALDTAAHLHTGYGIHRRDFPVIP